MHRNDKLIMMVLFPGKERNRMGEGAHIREGVFPLHKCVTSDFFFYLKIAETNSTQYKEFIKLCGKHASICYIIFYNFLCICDIS